MELMSRRIPRQLVLSSKDTCKLVHAEDTEIAIVGLQMHQGAIIQPFGGYRSPLLVHAIVREVQMLELLVVLQGPADQPQRCFILFIGPIEMVSMELQLLQVLVAVAGQWVWCS